MNDIIKKKFKAFIIPYKIGFDILTKQEKLDLYNQIETDFLRKYWDMFGYRIVEFYDRHSISDFFNS